MKIKKSQLRQLAKQNGEQAVLLIAQGIQGAHTKRLTESEQRYIVELFKEVLDVEDLTKVSIKEMAVVLEPESLLERFAAKKASHVATKKDFVQIKGGKGQLENYDKKQMETENDHVGFKCLHYSVTESNGSVDITIIKKI